MSAFSEYLNACVNRYVESSERSKNDLIHACQVNRSTFFQCLRGTRVPTPALFQTLLKAFQLPPGEEEQFRQLYYIAQIGEPVYQSRKWAGTCLETLAELSGASMPQIHQFVGTAQLTATRAAIYGEDQIFQELCHLAQAELFLEKPCIDLFLPRYNSPFFEYLKVLYRGSEDKTVRLRQLVQFPRKKERKAKASLAFFNSTLFFLGSNCSGYEAYYYYTDAVPADVIGVLYPYSVITSTGVLLINEEMNQGLFFTAPDILGACRRQFEETKGKAKPFLKTFREYEQMIEYFGDDWQGSGRGYQYFSTPCLGTYLSKEMVKQYSPVGLQKQSLRYYNGLKKGLPRISFCSKAGIWEFARTGAVPDYLHGLASPLEQKDRKAVLETMLNHSQDKGGIYLMDENEQAVSDEFVVSFSEDRYILVYRKGFPGQRIHLFQEQNLLDAFADYFQALETSQHLRPRVELEQVLREAIACCS